MLRRIKTLRGNPLAAQDGEIGQVHDFLFDDSSWNIRYVVADTSQWLPGRKVLLRPPCIVRSLSSDYKDVPVPVELTRDQIKESPDIDTEKPVSRQQEAHLHQYFAWPFYWTPSGQLNSPIIAAPTSPADVRDVPLENQDKDDDDDPHLRSDRKVEGYTIEATDGKLGHIEDMIVDDEAWKIRYLIVDTKNWLPGKKVLVATGPAIGDFNSIDRCLSLGLNRETIKSAPAYEGSEPIERDYEVRLHNYYGLTGYWE
tara:strand:+ start:112 stop:879 length:768 start_codon:yes stop_codon:yes gene_type:complete